MREAMAPAAGRPVRGGFTGSAAALLVLLSATGCLGVDAPARSAHAAEGEGAPADAGAAGTLAAACDLAAWVVDDALGVEAETAEDPPGDLLQDAEDEGCRLTAEGSFADLPEEVETPVDLLWDSFEDSGWHEDPRYAADTDQTSAVGMWKGGVLCVMGAVWAAPGEFDEYREPSADDLRYDVMVECGPARAPPLSASGMMA